MIKHYNQYYLAFKTINTAFFITAVPSCPLNTTNCTELEKLNQMGFIIGYREGRFPDLFNLFTRYQSYAAFRLKSNPTDLDFLERNNQMPYHMEFLALVMWRPGKANLWPKDGDGIQYLAAVYSERDFAICYLIKESDGVYLYIRRLVDLDKTSLPHKMSELSWNIQLYIGFIKTLNYIRRTFAVFVVDNKIKGIEFEPVHFPNGTTKDHFLEQVPLIDWLNT